MTLKKKNCTMKFGPNGAVGLLTTIAILARQTVWRLYVSYHGQI